MGKKAIFDTHGADSELMHRDGSVCTVARPLRAEEYDEIECGPMFHVVFPDGFEADAFEDELEEVSNG